MLHLKTEKRHLSNILQKSVWNENILGSRPIVCRSTVRTLVFQINQIISNQIKFMCFIGLY